MKTSIILFFLATMSCWLMAQDSDSLTVEAAVQISLKNHPSVRGARMAIEREKQLKKTAVTFDETELSYKRGEINSEADDYEIEVTQGIKFPSVYVSQSKLQQEKVVLQENVLIIAEIQLEGNVRQAYVKLAHALLRLRLLEELETTYEVFADVAGRRFELGEINALEKVNAQAQHLKIVLERKHAHSDVEIYRNELSGWMNSDQDILLPADPFLQQDLIKSDSTSIEGNPSVLYMAQSISMAQRERKVVGSSLLPSFSVGYFNQQIEGTQGFSGFKLGLNVPLFFWGNQGRVQAAKINIDIAKTGYEDELIRATQTYDTKYQEMMKFQQELVWYQTQGMKTAESLIHFASIGYQEGEIDYLEYIQSMDRAIRIKLDYLESLKMYRLIGIELRSLIGQF